MIFMTVGSQMPFDRLTMAVDQWAKHNVQFKVFAQIGLTEFQPDSMEYAKTLSPADFKLRLQQCSLVIAHAGMGSIISACEFGKPLIIIPRKGALRETRNDHQFDSARALLGKAGISVAWDEIELVQVLDRLIHSDLDQTQKPAEPIQFINALRDFIHSI